MMNESKLNNRLFLAVLASETIHVFCCVLPTVFSILSLMAGFGLAVTMPTILTQTHDFLHHYEVPMIIFSLFILICGWGAYFYSRQMSCRDNDACDHTSCARKASKTKTLMVIASVLFIVNVTVYTVFHRHADVAVHIMDIHEHEHEHEQHS